MGYVAEKVIDGKTIVLRVEYDDMAESPRGWENLGTMVCWHRRYDLGDEHKFDNEEEFIRTLAEDVITYDYIVEKCDEHFEGYSIKNVDHLGYQGWGIVNGDEVYSDGYDSEEEALDDFLEMKEDYRNYYVEASADIDDLWELINEHYIILPLYLYDHSGITMNTTGFSCGWDSGQVGYIYASKDKFRKETGYNEGELFENGVAVEMLKNEVKTYDQFLRGDVFGFILEEKVKCECCGHIDNEHIDSCWGFYGDKHDSNNFEDMKGHIDEKYHVLFDELEYK